MSAGLTPRMALCLDLARRFIAEHGHAPSLDELKDGLGLASKSGVHRLLNQLQDRGHLSFDYGRARSLRLVEEDLSPARLQRMSTAQLTAAAAVIAAQLASRRGAGGPA